MELSLRVRRGADAGAVFELRPGAHTLGRGADNAIVLADDKVSTAHARLDVDEAGATVTDLNSTNGTFVNEQAVAAPTRVRPGDAIQVGNTVLLLGDGGPAVSESVTTSVRVVLEDDDTILQVPLAWSPEETTQLLPPSAQGIEAGELRRLYGVLSAVYRVSTVVGRSTTPEGIFSNVLDVVFDILPADHGSVLLAEYEGKALHPVAGRRRDVREQTIRVSETIVRNVLASGRGVLTRDATHDERFRRVVSIHAYGIRSAICVPIRTPRQVYGVMYLDTHSVDRQFTQHDLELLTSVGGEVGLALENLRLIQQNLQAERLVAIGKAVAGLSHYIKNILQGMEAARFLIPLALKENRLADLREAWTALDRNIELIVGLSLNMLSYSKRAGAQYALHNVNEVVEQAAGLVAQRAKEHGAELQVTLDPAIPEALIDRGALHCSLLNLLTNAIDATARGAIRVISRWLPDTRRFEVTVSDDGPGIPRELHEGIFQAFFTTKGSKGTGLGLAVSRKLIEELGGRLTVESEPGHGATFTISLPIRPEKPPK